MPDLPGLPAGAWIRLRGPSGSGSGAWDRVEQREKGDRACIPQGDPKFQGVWNLRAFSIPNPAASQILLNPKPTISQTLPQRHPCHIPNLTVSRILLLPKPAASQTLPRPKPCYIPNPAPFQTLPQPNSCHIPDPAASQTCHTLNPDDTS